MISRFLPFDHPVIPACVPAFSCVKSWHQALADKAYQTINKASLACTAGSVKAHAILPRLHEGLPAQARLEWMP